MRFSLLPPFLKRHQPIVIPNLRKFDPTPYLPWMFLGVGFLSALLALALGLWPKSQPEAESSNSVEPPARVVAERHRQAPEGRLRDFQDIEKEIGELEFKLRRSRLPEFQDTMSREVVEDHLETPNQRSIAMPDLLTPEEGRIGFPIYNWDKWVDPKDEKRWIAVLHVRDLPLRLVTRLK